MSRLSSHDDARAAIWPMRIAGKDPTRPVPWPAILAESESVVVKPKPLPPRHAAFEGEIGRAILEALRDSGETLATHDLTVRVQSERGPGGHMGWRLSTRSG